MGLRDLCLDINLAKLVGTGDDPDAILGRTAVYLAHQVEPVRALVPIGAVPMRRAVLVPRHGRAEAGGLDEQPVGIGHEIGAVHGGGYG